MNDLIPNLETSELQQRAANQNYTLIDIRRPDEWEQGIIPGAKCLRLHHLMENKDEWSNQGNYILICHSGVRSLVACKKLREAGFVNVWNYGSGMKDWYSQNLPVKQVQAA